MEGIKEQQYTYETYRNDVLQTRKYVLNNGLSVFLSVNKDEPRIQTYIATKAGSSNDPGDNTGLAHYLEHMLFKGTSKIGTKDWDQENVLLQQISDLYEQHKLANNVEERSAIYKEIDATSFEASKLAVPNELDKLYSLIGAKGTNAYTAKDRTVFMNDIPSTELNRWLKLEAERFKDLVLRLFHTELETVYEEFNRGLDNDFRLSWDSLLTAMFGEHGYGSHSVIGKGEHLKKPSMVNIHQFFETYYVPNHMAICLSGDLDFEKTITLVDRYFGTMESRPIPAPSNKAIPELTEPIEIHNEGPQEEHIYLAYRFPKAHSREVLLMNLISTMLSNDQAGVYDIDLLQTMKVLDATSFPMTMKEHSLHVLFGMPNENQPLEEVKDLLIQGINKIKAGDFSEDFLKAVIHHIQLKQLKHFEKNKGRAHFYVDAFVQDYPYSEYANYLEELSQITKEEIVAVANQFYQDNYVVAYKHNGEQANTEVVEKPPITPIQLNRHDTSTFYESFQEMETLSLKPDFIDFNMAVKSQTLNNQASLEYVHNKSELFRFQVCWEYGRDANKLIPFAIRYLGYLGTNNMSPEEVKMKFFELGCDFDVNSGRKESILAVLGLEESVEKGIELINHLLHNFEANEIALAELKNTIRKERADEQQNKNAILHKGMRNFALYGSLNPATNHLSQEEIDGITIEDLHQILEQLTQSTVSFKFTGETAMDEVRELLMNHWTFQETSVSHFNNIANYPYKKNERSNVYVYDYNQKQVEIVLLATCGAFNQSDLTSVSLFNEYFGSGLSSIVFQEVREAKALAYSAYSVVRPPASKEEEYILQGYLGTQPDKLQEAVDCLLNLMNEMPKSYGQFDASKEAAIKRIESERIAKSNLVWWIRKNKKLGITDDPRKQIYQDLKKYSLEDLDLYFHRVIQGLTFQYLILGPKEELNYKELEKLGKVQELSGDEIFVK